MEAAGYGDLTVEAIEKGVRLARESGAPFVAGSLSTHPLALPGIPTTHSHVFVESAL